MSEQPVKKPAANASLKQRSAARMAAVQCLYTLSVGGEALSPAQQVQILKKQLANNKPEQKLQVGDAIEPNYKLVENILDGIEKRGVEINSRLDNTLSTDWKRERMSPLLLAILQCGIFELFFDKEIAPKIVIDEYTRLTRHFFADAEVDFVHAALSKLSRQYGAK
ncbi:MAG: transcription antitermination protein NusB [Proteobacteria bacterium]|nr:transcription antitermination protein NusB [Pseudomonadota bacterium]